MSKYKAVKVDYRGKTFHSKSERDYYIYLKAEESAGRVRDVKCQVCFPLQPSFVKNGERFRAINYFADFTYVSVDDGKLHVLDRKGYMTDIFRLKQKLFEYKYPELRLEIV